jgi:hypothetical protein
MSTIRIDEGEDYLKKYQRWKKQKWWQRISPLLLVGAVLFLAVAVAVLWFGGVWIYEYIQAHGFNFNPVRRPGGGGAGLSGLPRWG